MLVEAVWLEDRGRLCFTTDSDEQVVRQSPNVLAFLFANEEQIGSTKGASKAPRAVAAEAQSLVYLVPVDFLVDRLGFKVSARGVVRIDGDPVATDYRRM